MAHFRGPPGGLRTIEGLQALHSVPAARWRIQLQTTGITPGQLPWFDKLMRKKAKNVLFRPAALNRFYFKACPNPPQIGLAGSLRGLSFHSHAATMNEPIFGRKLFALFPPRESTTQFTTLCPWPPWGDKTKSELVIDTALTSFFNSSSEDGGPSGVNGDKFALHPCHDLSVTALQWIVYEYPKLPGDRRPMLVMLEPGEALWIPDSWFHLTLNVDDSVYIHQPTCQISRSPESLVTKERTRAAVIRLCQTSKRFCHRYCHSFCPSCNDSDTGCGLEDD